MKKIFLKSKFYKILSKVKKSSIFLYSFNFLKNRKDSLIPIRWHVTVNRDTPFDPEYTPFDHAILSGSKGVSRYTVTCHHIGVMGYSGNATLSESLRYRFVFTSE